MLYRSKEVLAGGDIRDYREVIVWHIGGSRDIRIFHKNHIKKFVEATRKLHHTPGINPHSKLECSKIWRISSAPLALSGPYWWTTPSLNADGTGVPFVEGSLSNLEILWEDEEYVRRLEQDQ